MNEGHFLISAIGVGLTSANCQGMLELRCRKIVKLLYYSLYNNEEILLIQMNIIVVRSISNNNINKDKFHYRRHCFKSIY